MDPSCTIGFYCGSREEFRKLRQEAEKVLTSTDNCTGQPTKCKLYLSAGAGTTASARGVSILFLF